MKRYAFILLVLLSAGTARAQRYEKNILGIRAGVNVSTYDISIEDVRINTGSRAGFHFAVTDQILLHRSLPLYLETGIGFSRASGQCSAKISAALSSNSDLYIRGTRELRYASLVILILSFRFPPKHAARSHHRAFYRWLCGEQHEHAEGSRP